MFSFLLRVPVCEVSWLKPQLTPNYKVITCHSTLTSRTHFTQNFWLVAGWRYKSKVTFIQHCRNLVWSFSPVQQSPGSFMCFAEFSESRIFRLESTRKPKTSSHHNWPLQSSQRIGAPRLCLGSACWSAPKGALKLKISSTWSPGFLHLTLGWLINSVCSRQGQSPLENPKILTR